MTRIAGRLRRFRTAGGIAGFTLTAIIAATIPGVALTNASWNDQEYVHGGLGAVDCTNGTSFATRGAGKLIGGTLLGTNLDALADLHGVLVTNGASGVAVDPVSATSLGGNAYANPLDVSALGTIDASLGPVLQLPLDTSAGALNQYGRAETNGYSAGASGFVSNSGALALTSTTPSDGLPTFATVNLDSLLDTLGLGDVSGLGGVQLQLGAVSSAATLNGCEALWQNDLASNLTRSYNIAGLDTQIESPLVADLTSDVTSTTTALSNTVAGLAGSGGVVQTAVNGLTGSLGTLLGGIGIGSPTVTVSATADFSKVNALLSGNITDSNGIVDIDLGNGTITINTAALFNDTNGLNELAPNTPLILDAAAVNALTSAVTSALSDYVTEVTNAINAAIAAIQVNLDISLPVSLVLGPGGAINVTANNVSLADLLAGTATLNASITCNLGIPALCTAEDGVLSPLLTGVTNALEEPIGSAIQGALTPTVNGLLTNLDALTSTIASLLGNVDNGLFSGTSLLSIVINAQNAPMPANSNPLPAWAAGLPGPTTSPYGSGRYDISAIRIVVAGTISVDLAHSSVGSNSVTP